MATYNIRAYGAVGDGTVLDTEAIQHTIDMCHKEGGGTVLVPAGAIFRTGSLVLRSFVELHVERGATLAGSGDWADYTERVRVGALTDGTVAGAEAAAGALLIARDATDVAITGGGVIDGAGRRFIERELGHIHRMPKERPFAVFLMGCAGVTVRDITIRDSALWSLRLSGCQDVTVHSVRIRGDQLLPNNDGIDIDHCKRVRVSDCDIITGDDGIALKACDEFPEYGACEDIVVTGCTIDSRSSGLVIGCDIISPVRNVVFSDCVVRSSHRGLSINLSDRGDVENVLFANMVVQSQLWHADWWGRGEPIYVAANPWRDDVGRVRRVRFRNILARAENGVLIHAAEPGLVEDVVLEGVDLELDRWTDWPGGEQDLRPCPGEGIRRQPTVGFFVENASGVRLDDCSVAWTPRTDPGRQPVVALGAQGFQTTRFANLEP
jgi:hypothetical protein